MDANRAQTPLGGTRIGARAALRLGVDRQAELLHVGNGKIGDRLRETLRALELVGALDAALQQRRRLRILHIAKDPSVLTPRMIIRASPARSSTCSPRLPAWTADRESGSNS